MTENLFLSIIAFVAIGCLAFVVWLCNTAPYGEQDEDGFHFVEVEDER